MFIKNFKYLISLTGKTQKLVCSEMNITESAVWQWTNKTDPTKNTLRRIARYFSDSLLIPIDLFEDGNALLLKDFEILIKEKRIQAQPLQGTDKTVDSSLKTAENLSLGEITDQEKSFLATIRRLIHGRPDIPASHTSLSQILELETLTLPGSDTHQSIIRMIQGLRRVNLDKAGEGPYPPTSEDDKK